MPFMNLAHRIQQPIPKLRIRSYMNFLINKNKFYNFCLFFIGSMTNMKISGFVVLELLTGSGEPDISFAKLRYFLSQILWALLL